jgi:MFS family permease
MTLCTVLVGSLVDAIGLRKAVLLGLSTCLVSRGVMAFSGDKWTALVCGLFPLAVGEALMTPVMLAAVRRYSTTAQRSISFAILYALMNAGLGLGGVVSDKFRNAFGEHGLLTLPVLHVHLTTYRALFLVGFVCTLPNLLLIYFCLRDGVEATDQGVQIKPSVSKYPNEGFGKSLLLTIKDSLRDTCRIFEGLWRVPTFYRFLLFLSLVVGVRLITYHMYSTYPAFGVRELGEKAPISSLWAINQFLIVILVPLVGAVTQKISAYRMVVVGSFIAAASVFFMALPPMWFQPLASGWLGDSLVHRWLRVTGTVNPYYVMIFFFVVFVSVGEALWSPRLFDYTSSIAPKGQEASYMSLSYLPFLVAKTIAGFTSGFLLNRYCPETGPRDSPTLWLIIALSTMITPIGLLVFRRYIRVHEAGRPQPGA